MLKVYLAGSWSRKEELAEHIVTFHKYGIPVVSRWLNEPVSGDTELADIPDDYLISAAITDLHDLAACDVLILFSNGYGSENVGGGRFFESGIAYQQNKPVITVGDPEMIFQRMGEDELMYTCETLHDAITLVLTWQNELDQAHSRMEARRDNIAFVQRLNDEGGQQYALDFGGTLWGGI